ncbi:MAG TPA: ThiF family adenylyltransferase, partial [Steroidobacteraceae bacterium]|nr:ThiF family adenylyltransferase [Steroidobacteraceae bacterium]
MKSFTFARTAIDAEAERARVADPACGGYVAFEGWVRDHNEGRSVRRLEYEAFEPLAVREGERIIAEAIERFGVEHASCVHRVGDLGLEEMAVWVGVSSRHRQEAFLACRYIIDEVKHRVPIWKKEHYRSGDSGWVNCERCAAGAIQPAAGAGSAAARTPGHGHAHEPGYTPGPRGPLHGQDHSGHGHDHGHAGGHRHEGGTRREHSAQGPEARDSRNGRSDYSRQMALKEVGAAGQAKLRAARVLVVGAGGLGVPVLSYLAGAGVGRIGIVDGDRVEPSNLHRQPLYGLGDAGEMKAPLAATRLAALNPDVDVQVYGLRLDAANGPDILAAWDLVIDCTDNFSTKFLINDLCVRAGKPAILSSIYQYEGQLQVMRPERGGACLRCIWPEATRDGLVGNCAQAGVLGPVPGVFGSLQALEALKLLLDLPGQLGDELLLMDLLTLQVSRMQARRARACSAGPCVRIPAAGAIVDPAALELHFASLGDAREQGYTVIDVREPAEVAAEPAPAAGVRHLPVRELLRGESALEPGARYLLLCSTGRRSLAAAQELAARGFTGVRSQAGGLAALKAGVPA